MSYWNWALYIGASFVALRSLISLMTQHKENYKQEVMQKHLEAIAATEAETAETAENVEQPKQNANTEQDQTVAA